MSAPRVLEAAARARELMHGMLDAMESHGAGSDEVVVRLAVGALAGCVAAATTDPEATLEGMISIARGCVSGELLLPEEAPHA